MEDIYHDGTYLNNNPSWHAEDSPWKAAQIKRMLDRQGLNPVSICEVGCGAGEVINCLRRELPGDIDFHGYEISPQAYAICSKKTQDNLKFHLADLLQEDRYFDLVMAIDVFEHVEDFYGFLRNLKKKGDYKLFHIPLDLSVRTVLRIQPIMYRRKTVGHIHHFIKDTAIASLEDMGYDIVDYFYTNSAPEPPKRGVSGNITKIIRKALFYSNSDFTARLLGGYSLMVLAR
jgi:hypothetical protein